LIALPKFAFELVDQF